MKKFYTAILTILVVSFISVAQENRSLEYTNNEIDSAFFHYKDQLELAQERSSPFEIVINHLQLGEFYYHVGVFSESIDQYNRALEFTSKITNDSLPIILKNNIGKVHLSLKNFELAENYFHESLKVSSKIHYVKGKAVSKGFLGTCYEKKGEYLKALDYQKESLELFEIIEDYNGIAIVNENIGSIYEDLEQYDLAYEYFEKAYSYLKEANNETKTNILNNLGDVYRKTGRFNKAIEYTQNALKHAQVINDNHQIESAHKDLAKVYAIIGEFEKAYQHLQESEKINRERFYSQNTNQINVLQTIHETKQKEAQIQLLLQQNNVNKANQRLLIVAIVAIAIVTIVLFIYLNRKRKQKLKLQTYKQRTLKAELEKKVFEEKNLQNEVYLKTSALSRYSLHLAQKNKILSDLSHALTNIAGRRNIDVSSKIKQLVKEINFNLHQEHEWDEFMNFFKEIHPDFMKKLTSLSEENLSPAELRLGMLLRLNLSSKEIASILRVTPDSVRVARYRLRKKLPIEQKEELVNFMIEL